MINIASNFCMIFLWEQSDLTSVVRVGCSYKKTLQLSQNNKYIFYYDI